MIKEFAIDSPKTNKMPGLKVKFQVKLVAFIAATFFLSIFFEGYRQVSKEPSLFHFALLLIGTVMTGLLIWLQAFWIYIEEKSKGALTKKVVHFDKLEGLFLRRAGTLTNIGKEGDDSEAGVTE